MESVEQTRVVVLRMSHRRSSCIQGSSTSPCCACVEQKYRPRDPSCKNQQDRNQAARIFYSFEQNNGGKQGKCSRIPPRPFLPERMFYTWRRTVVSTVIAMQTLRYITSLHKLLSLCVCVSLSCRLQTNDKQGV